MTVTASNQFRVQVLGAATGTLGIEAFNNNVGTRNYQSAAISNQMMIWQSAWTTNDGKLIELWTGNHSVAGLFDYDNSFREYDPNDNSYATVFPTTPGQYNTSYDNRWMFYIPAINSVVVPNGPQFLRGQGTNYTAAFPRSQTGETPTGRPLVVGTGANDLIRPDTSITNGGGLTGWLEKFNPHQAWSTSLNAGFMQGPNTSAQTDGHITFVVPTSGLGLSHPQPYYAYSRTMPSRNVSGADPSKAYGRDGACFAGNYVYWVGGNETTGESFNGQKHFFRMLYTPHLSATNATITIERLQDFPGAGFWGGLLMHDPYAQALLCVCAEGVYAFDLTTMAWSADLTPAAYRADYPTAAWNPGGKLPAYCLGGFIDTRGATTHRKFVWAPGRVPSGGGESNLPPTQYNTVAHRYRSLKLTRNQPLSALSFPGTGQNITTTGSNTIKFGWKSGMSTHAPLAPQNMTVIYKGFPILYAANNSQYYTAWFWGNNGSFTWPGGGFGKAYIGCHPFPGGGGPMTTTQYWEMAVDGGDLTNSQGTAESPNNVVVGNQWNVNVTTCGPEGANYRFNNYFDYSRFGTSSRAMSTTTTGDYWTYNGGPPFPMFCWGDAPWGFINRSGTTGDPDTGEGAEIWKGYLRGFQIYSSVLSSAQIAAVANLETDSQVLAACSANGITSLWYLCMNPTPTDVTDKSGNGRHPAWYNANRPGLINL